MFENMLKRLRSSSVGRSASVLSRKDQGKIFLVMILQIMFGLLDLLGIAIVGILGALAIRGVQSEGPGDKVNLILKYMGLTNSSFQSQVAILGTLAVILLIGKTIFYYIHTKNFILSESKRRKDICKSSN